jgi:hypothetical protein
VTHTPHDRGTFMPPEHARPVRREYAVLTPRLAADLRDAHQDYQAAKGSFIAQMHLRR